jgi:hypothetical protein
MPVIRRTTLPLRSCLLLPLVSWLVGCGDSPPSGDVGAAIAQAVRNVRADLFQGTPENSDVVAVSTKEWKKEGEMQGGGGQKVEGYSSEWTAKLRVKEPIGYVILQMDGTYVGKTVLKPGEEYPFGGSIEAMKAQGQWQVHAMANQNPWDPIIQGAGQPAMGYNVIQNGETIQNKIRGGLSVFEPLSRYKPYVEDGSTEWQAMAKGLQEKLAKAQQAAMEKQQKIQADNAEKQRLAQEDLNRKQAEAAAKSKMDLHAKHLPMIKPFQSQAGAALTIELGPLGALLGSPILEVTVDEPALAVKGKGVDLREMPFRDFTIEGAVDEKTGALMLKSSIIESPTPLVFGGGASGALNGPGMFIVPLSDADRAKVDALVALGKKLQAAAPAELRVEVIDAAKVKERQAALQPQASGISGTVLYRNRVEPHLAPLFSGNLAANRQYAWKNKEAVAVRMAEPIKGSGIYIRGWIAPSDNLQVVVNGVHKAKIELIPKSAAALVSLPPDLEILDLRFEALGSVQCPGIALIK